MLGSVLGFPYFRKLPDEFAADELTIALCHCTLTSDEHGRIPK